ncbi:MAG: WG repeat-containing protein [Ignavibacteriales bacterium]
MKKTFKFIFITAILLSLSINTYAFSDMMVEKFRGTEDIILYLNSPKAFVGGNETVVDSSNHKVFPVLIQNSTLIPLRFVAENLKAQVKWDEKMNMAAVILGSKEIKIKSGSTSMLVNGKESKLSVPAKDIENRLFIPLRAVVEAFGKKVFWDDRGLIIISDREKPLDSNKDILEVLLEKYDIVGSFNDEGLSLVSNDNKKYGFIDSTGTLIVEYKYDDTSLFPFEGFSDVEKDGKWGFIDNKGKEITELKYDEVDSFKEGVAAVKKNGKWGFIDRTGKEITELKYDEVNSFCEGTTVVRKEKNWMLINNAGKEVMQLNYDKVELSNDGVWIVSKNGKYGFIDSTGKEVIKLEYDSAECFQEGFSIVSKNRKYGFIDRTGKPITKLDYDSAEDFDGGSAIGKRGSQIYRIDTNGREFIQEESFIEGEIKMINIKTDKGNIKLEVYPELMPITTENFLGLVKNSFYDGLKFHRVEDWVIQGGDPRGNGTGGSDKTIKLETNSKLKNIRGAVAMARSSDPDSASSQFYILKTDASWLDGSYAVFGNVVEGMDVVDSIAVNDKMIKVEELTE